MRAVRLRCQASRFHAFHIRRGSFSIGLPPRAVRRFGANKFYHFYFLRGNNDSNNTLRRLSSTNHSPSVLALIWAARPAIRTLPLKVQYHVSPSRRIPLGRRVSLDP